MTLRSITIKNKTWISLNWDCLPYYILFLFGILMFFMGFMNHYYFRTYVFDYGNYNFAFWDYAHFRISSVPTYPGNFLQDHFSFLMMFLIPFYWLLNWITGTYTLILIQNVMILMAAWYTFRLIRLKSDNIWLGAGVMIYYFILLGRYSTFACDVNLAVMSATLIPVFLYYFERRKYVVTTVILILALLSRENIPIWFIFIFIVLLFQNFRDRRATLYCIGGIVISVLYFILLFQVLIPSVESDEKQYILFNYAALGADPGEALIYILQHPLEAVKLFFVNHLDNPRYNGIKLEFYLVYLISGGAVLLLRPQYLIWFIPIVAQKVLNDYPIRWGILTYYSIEVVTLLPLSVFLVISSLRNIRLQKGLVILVILLTAGTTFWKMIPENRVVPASYRPDKENFLYSGFYHSFYDLRATHRILKQIPGNAGVSASEQLFPHLAQRMHVYVFPEVRDAEYIAISVLDDYFTYSHMENEWAREKYLTDPGWELIESAYPVFLLKKRKAPGDQERRARIENARSDTMYCNFGLVDSSAQKVLFDSGIPADELRRISSGTGRDELNSLLLTGNDRYGNGIRFSDMDKYNHIRATVWVHGNNNIAFIVARSGKYFYEQSNSVIEEDSGWQKVELSTWIPGLEDPEDFTLYLWNSSREEALVFDDFQLIRSYRE